MRTFPTQELAGGNSDLLRLLLPVGLRRWMFDATRAEASEWSIAIISIEMPGTSEVIVRAGTRLRLAGAAPPP